MKEIIYNIDNATAGRVITLTGLSGQFGENNLLGIINKSTGDVLYTPLDYVTNLYSVTYNNGTMVITLKDTVPAITAGDKLFVKLYTDEELDEAEIAAIAKTERENIMGGYLPSRKQYDELFAIASDHKYWILEDDGSLHQTDIVTPIHPMVGEVIDVPSIDEHLPTGYVITSYKSGTTDQEIIDLIESYDGHDAIDIQTLVNEAEVTPGLWRVKEVKHLGGQYDIDLFFYEAITDGKTIKDVYNKFETVAKQGEDPTATNTAILQAIPSVAGLETEANATANKNEVLSAIAANAGIPTLTIPDSTAAQELAPNVLYIFDNRASTLTLTLGTPIVGKANEYHFFIICGSTAPTVNFPSGISWNGGDAPTIAADKTYEISILNNVAAFFEV